MESAGESVSLKVSKSCNAAWENIVRSKGFPFKRYTNESDGVGLRKFAR